MSDIVVDSKTEFAISPDNIVIFGGGRWARVLTETICNIVHPDVKVAIYSSNNTSAMTAWAESLTTAHKIEIWKEVPAVFTTNSVAAIVVNAARDHKQSVTAALRAGASVLVEKPVTLTYRESKLLADYALKQNATLAAAHVFLFAGYLDNFSKLVSGAGKIIGLRLEWTDPGAETRYGENKKYDASLPVFADWLPHILAIISKLISEPVLSCEELALQKGGAVLKCILRFGHVPGHLRMERNGVVRERYLEVTTESGLYRLDFSVEPGNISYGGNKINADPDWHNKERPVASMLRAFLKGVAGKGFDPRLHIDTGLEANKVIDLVNGKYRYLQVAWLADCLNEYRTVDEDMRYALTEIFQINGSLAAPEIEEKISRFSKVISGGSFQSWSERLKEKIDPAIIMQMGSV